MYLSNTNRYLLNVTSSYMFNICILSSRGCTMQLWRNYFNILLLPANSYYNWGVGQDSTGEDRTGQDRTGQERPHFATCECGDNFLLESHASLVTSAGTLHHPHLICHQKYIIQQKICEGGEQWQRSRWRKWYTDLRLSNVTWRTKLDCHSINIYICISRFY